MIQRLHNLAAQTAQIVQPPVARKRRFRLPFVWLGYGLRASRRERGFRFSGCRHLRPRLPCAPVCMDRQPEIRLFRPKKSTFRLPLALIRKQQEAA
ncbi:hypothetical protein GCWU000324_02803 [Kingella oralis ATCC 51147]|uniref:Uncharacterized protein n=1 Tax=Kingella oralis ATCC 51147 TaxID=629741 RepID=C4GM70_9NEIS|nr:hypothetical protein GCWU000324_02803 [Kingella oralis ATCC 51147]